MTVEQAEQYLEPFMVPGIRIWDSEAYPVSPMIVRKLLTKVVKLRDSRAEPDPQGLQAALLQLIRANENPTDDFMDDVPLHDLLTKALKYKTR